MNRIGKSFSAARSAMGDAVQSSWGYNRGDNGHSGAISPTEQGDAHDGFTLAFSRGDDGSCVPNESFTICLEKTSGLPDAPVFLVARVCSASGQLKGTRAHTLYARRHEGDLQLDQTFGASSSSAERNLELITPNTGGSSDKLGNNRHHVFSAKRDLRCHPCGGDVLIIEAFIGQDTSPKSNSWSHCYARGQVSVGLLTSYSNGQSNMLRVPLHKNLIKGFGDDGEAFAELRVIDDTEGVLPQQPREQPLRTPHPPFNLLGDLINLDVGSNPASTSLLNSHQTTTRTKKPISKRVFFVRHGESKWNEAQRELLLSKMAKFDHPLTSIGVLQALESGRNAKQWVLRNGKQNGSTLTAHTAQNDKNSKDVEWSLSFQNAKKCFVSPLTRAVQTAALFLSEHPNKQLGAIRSEGLVGHEKTEHSYGPGDGSVTLLKALREVKSTHGSLDTIGIEKGHDILRRAFEKTRESLVTKGHTNPNQSHTNPNTPNPALTINPNLGQINPQHADQCIDSFAKKVNVNDAFGAWWTGKDSVDSVSEIDERVDDVLETIRLSSDPCVIIVGHSLWFQHAVKRLLKRQGSEGYVHSNQELAARLQNSKIDNCAVVGIDLVFDLASGTPTVEDMRFMFGSGSSDTKSNAPNNSVPNDLPFELARY